MKSLVSGLSRGVGKATVIITILVVFGVVFLLGRKNPAWQGPTLQLAPAIKGIGQKTQIHIKAIDPHHNVKSISVEVVQGGRSLRKEVFEPAPQVPPWWKFWVKKHVRPFTADFTVGRSAVPQLKEGRAKLHIYAIDDSLGRWFFRGRRDLWLDLPVSFTPPQVEVLTKQHYINQGGCEMVVFKVSPGTEQSGVMVGTRFFPSWPVKQSEPEIRLCLFAFPYNLDPSAPICIIARDVAGNETVTNFDYKLFPKTFHSSTIDITDDFLRRVVPPIMSHTPELQDQGSLLKNFLLVNGRLRQIDAEKFVALSHQTSPHFLWSQAFLQLSHSKVEASFADHRTYLYKGKVIDHQTHLGFDLAVVAHTRVLAANNGVVVYAKYLGIYGNAVVIDHGCGLQSLYGHLSSIEVKVGEHVKRGQEIGRSGQTGLAGGDHLHFAILLDGLPVNTVEWWDPHWIHDHIQARLAPYE